LWQDTKLSSVESGVKPDVVTDPCAFLGAISQFDQKIRELFKSHPGLLRMELSGVTEHNPDSPFSR
jgi:hypothetical protein